LVHISEETSVLGNDFYRDETGRRFHPLPAIVIESLSKVYRGRIRPAIDSLTLEVDRGEFFGFLGPNGAGKTTTIKILMTLLKATSGRAEVAGYDVANQPLQAMGQVGFMPENPGFYPGLTGRRHLRYWASLYGLNRSGLDQRIQEVFSEVGLAEATEVKAKAYSLGMKRRLALAGALLADPPILILDEPSHGLDPQGMAFVRFALQELHHQGRTIFLSSHLLGEVEKLCTKVRILNRGKLIKVGTPREITQATGNSKRTLEIETKGVDSNIVEKLRKVVGVTSVDLQGTTLRVSGSMSDELVADINRQLVDAEVLLLSSRRLEHSLEEAFLELTGDRS